MKNPFQALAAKMTTKNGTQTDRASSVYPEVPALWPTRSFRRHGLKPVVTKAPASYLVASLVARLSTTSVIYVDSAGVARIG